MIMGQRDRLVARALWDSRRAQWLEPYGKAGEFSWHSYTN